MAFIFSLKKEKTIERSKQILETNEKTPPHPVNKRSRDQVISPNDIEKEAESRSTRSLKQPKLVLDENGSPNLANFGLRVQPKSPSPKSLIDLFQNPSSTTLVPKVLLATKQPNSPFNLNDKKSFFQNQIGSSLNNMNADSSFSARLDLHMCHRNSTLLDSPETRGRGDGDLENRKDGMLANILLRNLIN